MSPTRSKLRRALFAVLVALCAVSLRLALAYVPTGSTSLTAVPTTVTLTNNSANSLLTIALGDGVSTSGRLSCVVSCTDGSIGQAAYFDLLYSAGQASGSIVRSYSLINLVTAETDSTQTLRFTPSFVDGVNLTTLKLTPSTTITPTIFSIAFYNDSPSLTSLSTTSTGSGAVQNGSTFYLPFTNMNTNTQAAGQFRCRVLATDGLTSSTAAWFKLNWAATVDGSNQLHGDAPTITDLVCSGQGASSSFTVSVTSFQLAGGGQQLQIGLLFTLGYTASPQGTLSYELETP